MRWTVLGSGGCTIIPKPLCQCRVCREARSKGIPYSRGGPSALLHDINLLIDAPAEIASQLNRCGIRQLDYLTFTHLDPDHVEGFRVVEQIALDFRSWSAYQNRQICLVLPQELAKNLQKICSQYGPVIDFYRDSGFVRLQTYKDSITIGDVEVTAIPVDRGRQTSFVYVFEKSGSRVVYAPCDVKPFPEHHKKVAEADLLLIQPGIFESGLKHRFKYPEGHISRKTLYTFEQTLSLSKRIHAKKVVFTHLEEYWNRSYGDYCKLEPKSKWFQFAYDGMKLTV